MHLGWVMPCQLHPSGNSLVWWPGLESWCQTVVKGLGVTELTGADNVMKGDGGRMKDYYGIMEVQNLR